MRALAFIATLLTPSVAFAATADGTCVVQGNATCWTSDYTSDGDPAASGYNTYVQATPYILTAMDYAALPRAVREAVWDKINEAAANDGVLEIANVAGMPPEEDTYDPDAPSQVDVYFTDAEAAAVYGAKVPMRFGWKSIARCRGRSLI